MAKPLHTDDLSPPSVQFSHFGVLHDGQQSKGSLFTSITVNVVIAIIVCIVGAAAKKIEETHRLTEVTLSLPPKPIEPIRPKIIPKPLPAPPVAKVEPPKIRMPEVKPPEPIKPVEVKMAQPAPEVPPAPPKRVTAPAAPKPVSLAHPQAASVVNESPHPSPVALGRPDNPIAPSNRPATSSVDLGQKGAPGMPASNTGAGPRATAVNLGSGSPGSQSMSGNGSRPVQGVKLGVPGGTGPLNSTSRTASTGPVNLGQAVPPMPKAPTPAATAAKAPKVLYKPRPEYTQEAIKLRIEGTVSVRLHVSATGVVQVLGVTSDLGHGLGESAIRAVQATRFQPATDASGNPVDWEGIVNVVFQLAG
ncbi:energy transducer TonB [Edaphobacter modestus]|uniref:TonB family protein n=1 Tax=Edaphobacter modestus TaxID=388466 RepID=A0A4Q7YZY1_9BACT|nr:energy transducer TonB [Edaphobacter modestus]RZU42803.1 TonB family protein [Edaphobacter modestus]